jgi:hypothetical protein
VGSGVTIHWDDRIPWQSPFAEKLVEGLHARGIAYSWTHQRVRTSDDIPILLGTSLWRDIEHDGGEFFLVDRCQYGDTNHWVSIGKNGRGFRAQWPEPKDASRWYKYGQELLPWRKPGSRVVLCGQVGSYSPDWNDERSWYQSVKATHFRPHPDGDNPTRLPLSDGWEDTRCAVVLNSSIAVQTVMCGIPTVTMDKGSMAWPVTGHALDDIRTPDREAWVIFLSWCQWSHDEVQQGIPWDSLL